MRWRSRICAALLAISIGNAVAQDRGPTAASLVAQFRDTADVAAKEKILYRMVQESPKAGPRLLELARTTGDNDTKWLAIRGLGLLKYGPAAPFLMESLQSPEHYVRANAARALGELHHTAAAPVLIRLLENEPDGGVIEQTSLALRMMKAREALPALKARMSHESMQTRCWLLDAIADLGTTGDLPFLAKYLYDPGSEAAGVPLCAVRAIAALTKEDFGMPVGNGIFDPGTPVLKARKWWEDRNAHAQ